jgi:excisionase family DNA binding protein
VTSTKSDPEWLTAKEIARRLSCSLRQVYKWMENGQFDEVKVFTPRVKRISHASYQRFVEKGENVQQP